MNRLHSIICSSGRWRQVVERELLPWGLNEAELGDDVLEIGPGFGATTRVLAKRVPALTVLELDHGYCERLGRELPASVTVVQGDATAMPFADARFSAVVCFTMLHHLPSPQAQDELLAEVSRVLRPGGLFAGTDSLGRGRLFRLIHMATPSSRWLPRACPIGCAPPVWPIRSCRKAPARFASARASRRSQRDERDRVSRSARCRAAAPRRAARRASRARAVSDLDRSGIAGRRLRRRRHAR